MVLSRNASLWKRFFAYLIDALVINFVILWPFKDYFLQIAGEIDLYNLGNVFSKFFLVSFVIAMLTILYWAVLEYFTKQSIGKILVGIKVKNLKSDYNFLNFFLRNIPKVSIVVLILDCIYMFFNENRQRFFEKISNTKVVERGYEL